MPKWVSVCAYLITAATWGGIGGFLCSKLAPIDSKIEQEGLTAAQIRRDTERQLQREEIKLLPEEDFNRLRRTLNYHLGRLEVIVTVKVITEDNEKIYNIRKNVKYRFWQFSQKQKE